MGMVMSATACVAMCMGMFFMLMGMFMAAAALVAVCVCMFVAVGMFMFMFMAAAALVAMCVSMFFIFMLMVIATAAVIAMFIMSMSMVVAATALVTMRMLRHMSHRLMIMVLATMAAGAACRMLAVIFYAIDATINMLVSSYIISTITDIFEIFLHYIYHLSA